MHFIGRLFICAMATYGVSIFLPRLSPSVYHSFTIPMNGMALSISYLMASCLAVAFMSFFLTGGKKSRR